MDWTILDIARAVGPTGAALLVAYYLSLKMAPKVEQQETFHAQNQKALRAIEEQLEPLKVIDNRSGGLKNGAAPTTSRTTNAMRGIRTNTTISNGDIETSRKGLEDIRTEVTKRRPRCLRTGSGASGRRANPRCPAPRWLCGGPCHPARWHRARRDRLWELQARVL